MIKTLIIFSLLFTSASASAMRCHEVFEQTSGRRLSQINKNVSVIAAETVRRIHEQFKNAEVDTFVSGQDALVLLFLFRDANFEIQKYHQQKFDTKELPSLYELANSGFFLPIQLDGFNYRKVFQKMTAQFVDQWSRVAQQEADFFFRNIENLIEFHQDIQSLTRFASENTGPTKKLLQRMGTPVVSPGVRGTSRQVIAFLRSFYNVERSNPLEPFLAKAQAVEPQLRFDGSWEKPWDVTHQYEMSAGTLFELTKGSHHNYRESWEVAHRYPVMIWLAGVVATGKPSVLIGNARWTNSRLDSTGAKLHGIPNQFRFVDFFPEGQSLKNFDPEAKYHFSGWRMLESYINNQILLSGNGKLWYHDRFAHFPGYLYLGWFPEVNSRFANKARYLFAIREMLREHDLYKGEVKDQIIERANEMARLLDFASGNITATLAVETLTKLPVSNSKLKGFHILGGEVPYINNFGRPFRPHFLQVKEAKEYNSTRDMHKAILEQLNELIDLPEALKQSLQSKAEELYIQPLTVQEVFDLVHSRPPM